MASDANQRKVFDFFVKHLETKDSFKKKDLSDVTKWSESSFKTYWSRQLAPFVVESDDGNFRISEAFRPYLSWEKFQQHVTQVRRVAAADYERTSFDKVRIYEFFMPLTNEAHLRTALDALFYRDSVRARLKTVPPAGLEDAFPLKAGETKAERIERICDWISNKFSGYSIYHVSGRFKAGDLVTREDAAALSRYIVDETTAVTRFIFPCKSDKEAAMVEFLFEHLFVRAVIEVVNGEDEIWMAETGISNRLHIWRVRPEDK